MNKGEAIVDLGYGAGADLCAAALLVGDTGKMIGLDTIARDPGYVGGIRVLEQV